MPCVLHQVTPTCAGYTQSLSLVGEYGYDTFEFLQLYGVEFAVTVRRVDTMHAGSPQASNVLAKDPFIEAIILVEGSGNRGPHAVQILARQSLAHGHRFSDDTAIVHDRSPAISLPVGLRSTRSADLRTD